jgi:hypothetical protein
MLHGILTIKVIVIQRFNFVHAITLLVVRKIAAFYETYTHNLSENWHFALLLTNKKNSTCKILQISNGTTSVGNGKLVYSKVNSNLGQCKYYFSVTTIKGVYKRLSFRIVNLEIMQIIKEYLLTTTTSLKQYLGLNCKDRKRKGITSNLSKLFNNSTFDMSYMTP